MDRRTFIASSGAAALAAHPSRHSARPAPGRLRRRRAQRPVRADLPAAGRSARPSRRPRSVSTRTPMPGASAASARARWPNGRGCSRENKAALAELAAVDRRTLSPAAKLNLEVVTYSLTNQTIAPQRFGLDSAIRPYRIFQQGGAYFSVPDFLNTAHTINTKDDAEAYLSRLEAFAVALDQDSAMQRIEASRGYVAPAWSLDLTLGQMAKLREQKADDSSIVQSLARRAKAKDIDGRWERHASRIVEERVYPALDRQMALVRELKPLSQPGDGVWRVPHGDEIYAVALEQATTTRFTPAEVHRMGLQQVAQISAELDRILRSQGFTPRQRRRAARRAQRRSLTALSEHAPKAGPSSSPASTRAPRRWTRGLPAAFATLPGAPLEIRRVPLGDPGRRLQRLLQPRLARRLEAGHLLHQPQGHRRLAEIFPSGAHLSRGQSRAITSRSASPRNPGDIPTSARSAASAPIAKAGRSMPSSLPTSSAPMPTRSSGRAISSPSCSAPPGWSSTPASIRRNGAARKRPTISSPPPASPGRDRSARSSAIAPRRGRRAATRSGTWPGAGPASEAKRALGRRFDLKQFHEVLKDGAMPLTILERRIRERTAAAKA